MIVGHPIGMYARWLTRLQYSPARIQTTQVSWTTMTITSLQRASHNLLSNEGSKGEPTGRSYRLEEAHQEDFFRFTRGRFVSDEQHQMSQRHVRFDVHELARLGAEAVGSKSCIGMEKYPDRMYNKAFLLTMDDGTQAVAKVANPNAGRPHFTTASEVATMEFVCLGDPSQVLS